MTIATRYNHGMEFLSVQGRGALFTVCIFLICVIVVHIAKLAFIGWRAYKKKEPKEKEEKDAPEPVYYIVEKKKKTSPQYKKPRKFKFQK